MHEVHGASGFALRDPPPPARGNSRVRAVHWVHDGRRDRAAPREPRRGAPGERRDVQPDRRPRPHPAGVRDGREPAPRTAPPLRRGLHPPSLGRRPYLRRAPPRRADDRGRAAPRRRRGHRDRARRAAGGVRAGDRAAGRGRHQADADPVLEPRAGRGGELPQDDRRDGPGRAGHPDQARRPPAQHADDRVPRQAEAGAEGQGDARGLRAARPPPRDPLAQVGARGSLVPGAPPAEVRGDQGDGRRPARRPRRAGRPGRDDPRARAGEGGHPRRTSRGARSTSTRSTTRWRRRAASSTRSTTSRPCA